MVLDFRLVEVGVVVCHQLDIAVALWEPLDCDVGEVAIGDTILVGGESTAEARSLHDIEVSILFRLHERRCKFCVHCAVGLVREPEVFFLQLLHRFLPVATGPAFVVSNETCLVTRSSAYLP